MLYNTAAPPRHCLSSPCCGLQADKSGQVAVERLQRTIREFELTIDLPRLLEEMDKDADGSVSYAEFKALLAA